MKNLTPKVGAAIGVGVAAGLLAPALPASAAQRSFDYRGCSAIGLTDNQGGQWGATGQVSGGPGCSRGWVQLHFTDAKGNAVVQEDYETWPSHGGAVERTGGEGSTVRYACVAVVSRSHGTWSPVYKIGSGSGGCGTP